MFGCVLYIASVYCIYVTLESMQRPENQSNPSPYTSSSAFWEHQLADNQLGGLKNVRMRDNLSEDTKLRSSHSRFWMSTELNLSRAPEKTHNQGCVASRLAPTQTFKSGRIAWKGRTALQLDNILTRELIKLYQWAHHFSDESLVHTYVSNMHMIRASTKCISIDFYQYISWDCNIQKF